MSPLTPSHKIFVALLLVFGLLAGVSVFLPQGGLVPAQELPIPKPLFAVLIGCIMPVIYGGLGLIGLKLSFRFGFAGMMDEGITDRQRYVIPAVIGAGLGIFFILADTVFSKFHGMGPLPHPPFPTSLAASATAGIGEEILFRLFFIPFWVWLVSSLLFKGKWQNPAFLVVTVFSAFAFAFAHLPAVMFLLNLKSFAEIPPAIMTELILLNGILSLFAAYYFRKYGFLAAVGIHFWTDIVWHVVWGVI